MDPYMKYQSAVVSNNYYVHNLYNRGLKWCMACNIVIKEIVISSYTPRGWVRPKNRSGYYLEEIDLSIADVPVCHYITSTRLFLYNCSEVSIQGAGYNRSSLDQKWR